MEQKFDGKDLIWTVLYLGLSAIFVGVIILMCTENGFNHDEGRNMFITITAPLDIKAQYSYSGYALGGMAYLLFLLVMRCVPNAWHNLNSFMRYLTHELTHLLMCILCFWRINEFVVRPEKEEWARKGRVLGQLQAGAFRERPRSALPLLHPDIHHYAAPVQILGRKFSADEPFRRRIQ